MGFVLINKKKESAHLYVHHAHKNVQILINEQQCRFIPLCIPCILQG